MRIPKSIEIISIVFIVAGPVLVLFNGNRWIRNKPVRNMFGWISEQLSPPDQYESERKAVKKELRNKLTKFYLNRIGWIILFIGAIIQIFSIIMR